jgi:2'-hydroxyisoflavone reductase
VLDENLLRLRLAEVDEEERPLWYPKDQIPQEAIDSTAAQAAGLRFRPTAMTAADTLHWAEEADQPALTDSFLLYEQEIIASLRSRA